MSVEWREIEKLRNGARYRKFINGKPTNSYKLEVFGSPRGNDPNLTRIVAAGDDDGNENGIGALITDGETVDIASRTDPSSQYYKAGGFRYTDIAIPKGSNIDVAYQSVYFSTASDPGTYIYGHDADDADDLNDNPHIISEAYRPRTSASAYWYSESNLSLWQDTPSLVSVIQEIIGRPGWSSGNAVMMLWIPITSENFKTCYVQAYEGTSALRNKIYIEWTEGGTTAYLDIPTRFKLFVQNFIDIAGRFKLQVRNYIDIPTRFTLWGRSFTDIATRFKLTVGTLAYKDIATRFKLFVQNFTDIATKFKLWGRSFTDIPTRFKLEVQNYSDIATRFVLQVTTDIATRFKLEVQNYTDIATRFKLTVQSYSDIAIRFKLQAQNYADVATRFVLRIYAYRNIATRFKLTVQAFKDVASLFGLVVQEHIDIATRFRIMLQPFINVATRFQLSFPYAYRDTSTRFFLYAPTWKELQIQAELADLKKVGFEL